MVHLNLNISLDDNVAARFRSIREMRGYSEEQAVEKLIELLVEKGGFVSLEEASIPDFEPVESEEEAMEFIEAVWRATWASCETA